MNKNIFLVLILILLLAGGGYYLWQSGVSEEPEPVTEVEDNEYHSAHYGVSFSYPDTYTMTEHDQGTAERMVHTVVLIDSAYANSGGMEGPPAIAVSVFENPENESLETWIRGNSYSNFKLATDETLTPTTVGGVPALAYTHSGLYETDAVVVMQNGRVYMFTAGWISADDQIRDDFKEVLNSVEFVAS